jgi:hypothetical protein
MPLSPIRMEDKIFSGSVSFTNTVECIQHYTSCNLLRPGSNPTGGMDVGLL